jgi:RNA-directed DNA polymerase
LIDITKFFPSIIKKYIKKELILTYNQSSDVAEFISNAITAPQKKSNGKRALITGSPLSQYFSYVINKRMFDELNELAKSQGIKFSVYVDDISFSSNKIISHNFLKKVFFIIKSNGFEVSKNKKDKKKFYRGKIGINSIITGIVMTKEGMFIPKTREKKIEDQLVELQKIPHLSTEFKTLYDKTISSIHQAILVNPIYEKYLTILRKIS